MDLARQARSEGEPAVFSVLDWVTAHMDAMEVGMQTFNGGGAPEPHLAYIKQKNPGITTFGYAIDLSMCMFDNCFVTSGTPNPALSSVPEEQFLHFSEDTQLQYVRLDGTVLGTETVPGCASPAAISPACRVKIFGWATFRWIPNLALASWQTWYAGALLGFTTAITPQIDGVFLDEHGPGFSIPLFWGYQTKPQSGGGIREYGGLRPGIGTSWPPIFSSLETQFNTDTVSWLTYLRGRFQNANKKLIVNTAQYIIGSSDLAYAHNLAAGGALTELQHTPFMRGGADEYAEFLTKVQGITSEGGVVDLYGDPCTTSYTQLTPGAYLSARDRYRMWKLGSYYVLKEDPGWAGVAYFDPNLCYDFGSSTRFADFTSEWLDAYAADVGQPLASPYVIQQGPGANVGCGSRAYKVFAREYERALVLVRAWDDRNCSDFSDGSAVTVQLPFLTRMLMPDRTLGPEVTSVLLRNAEALVMMRSSAP